MYFKNKKIASVFLIQKESFILFFKKLTLRRLLLSRVTGYLEDFANIVYPCRVSMVCLNFHQMLVIACRFNKVILLKFMRLIKLVYCHEPQL